VYDDRSDLPPKLDGRYVVVWGERMERSLVGGFGVVNDCAPNLLSKQNKKQPERGILENGENPEIRKIRKNKQKCTKPEFPKDPARRKESQKNKIREQNSSNKSQVKIHITRWIFKNGQ